MSQENKRYAPNQTPCGRTRREFLWEVGGGFAGLALIDLLSSDGFFLQSAQAAAAETAPGVLLAPKPSHFPVKAKHVIFFFMTGGPSHIDLFDPKPALTKHNGQPYQGELSVGSNNRPIGYLMQSPFPFKKHGQSGLEISSIYPHLSRHADDLCVVRSLYTDTAAHASGVMQMNTGSVIIGKPSLGSWLSYGLGTMSEDLPSFVVMTDPRGGPIGGSASWSAGFMPAAYQGTLFRSKGSPLLDLATPDEVSDRRQRHSLDLLNRLNQDHFSSREQESELAARIYSYELAYRMQTSASEVVDLDKEDEKTKDMYGLNDNLTNDFGRKCLIARRLVEKGVRFVQLYSGGGHGPETWDGHVDCITNHKLHGYETDQPMAALITDLKRSGLWDETLIIWGGEFGRTPTSEGVGKPGRDHNWYGFTMWLAGAGVKGGQTIGGTDKLGFKAIEDPYHVSDFHATVLHLMGLDHKRLTYFYHGLEERLTGQRGTLIQKALA